MTDLFTILTILSALAAVLVWAYQRWGWPGVAAVTAPVVGLVLAVAGRRRPRPPTRDDGADVRARAEVEAAQLERDAAALIAESAPRAERAAEAAVELDAGADPDAWLARQVEDVRAGRVR